MRIFFQLFDNDNKVSNLVEKALTCNLVENVRQSNPLGEFKSYTRKSQKKIIIPIVNLRALLPGYFLGKMFFRK